MQRHQRLAASLAAAALLAYGPRAEAAAKFSTLYNFVSTGGGAGDANNPYAGLVVDASGNLYGTTFGGGAAGEGAVYELFPPVSGQGAWTETLLYSFYATNHADGVKPTGRLVFGPHGELYGTTSSAGGTGGNGFGTVFELTPPAIAGGAWTETTLHVFTGTGGDGATPSAGLAIDSNGILYGTTYEGGSTATQTGPGYGTVFSLAPPATGKSWTETILYSFSNTGRDGITPQSDILLGAGGTLYGTTPVCSSTLSCAGTVFQLTPSGGGWTESVILGLPAGGASGSGPNPQLAIDSSGNLYGTTGIGVGMAFCISPPTGGATKWTHTILARFKADKSGGPQGGVTLGAGGVVYGTLTYGLHKSGGSIYRLTPPAGSGAWTDTTLYTFAAKPAGGGVFPVGSLVSDANGNYYGVTEIGGTSGVGTVFEITP